MIIHPRMYTYLHAYAPSHTHTHTHMQKSSRSSSPPLNSWEWRSLRGIRTSTFSRQHFVTPTLWLSVRWTTALHGRRALSSPREVQSNQLAMYVRDRDWQWCALIRIFILCYRNAAILCMWETFAFLQFGLIHVLCNLDAILVNLALFLLCKLLCLLVIYQSRRTLQSKELWTTFSLIRLQKHPLLL